MSDHDQTNPIHVAYCTVCWFAGMYWKIFGVGKGQEEQGLRKQTKKEEEKGGGRNRRRKREIRKKRKKEAKEERRWRRRKRRKRTRAEPQAASSDKGEWQLCGPCCTHERSGCSEP